MKESRCNVCDVQQPLPFWALNNIFRYTTEELCNIAGQYVMRKETAKLLPIPGSKEATPCSNNMAPSAAAVQNAKKGIKGGKKRRKRCP
jgi:hypothetical protein